MSPHTRKIYFTSLVYLSRYCKRKQNGIYKPFREMTREDILEGYLFSLKKEFSEDPDQGWINTYRTRAAKLLMFWKYLTQPDLPLEERQTPPQLKGLRFPRKPKTLGVKHEDLWTAEEHEMFLKYCEDPRLTCFHAMQLECGFRPSEGLALKIGDIHFKQSSSTGKKYAEFWIGGYGKMRKPRPASISDSIPFFNKWVAIHPQRNDINSYLFPSMERSAKYSASKPLEEDSLRRLYSITVKIRFSKMLENRKNIPQHDRQIIKQLQQKPTYPYLRRHEFATENAPKVSSLVFNQLMGHSSNSKMREVYTHELGSEGNKEFLIMKGILTREETLSPSQIRRTPKYCPMCNEPNEQNAKFCFKCNFVVSQEGFWETREEEKKVLNELETTKKELEILKREREESNKNIEEINRKIGEMTNKISNVTSGENIVKKMQEKLVGQMETQMNE